MEYDVVVHADLGAFRLAVRDKLNEGWELQGGICVHRFQYESGGYSGVNTVWAQAFVRNTEHNQYSDVPHQAVWRENEHGEGLIWEANNQTYTIRESVDETGHYWQGRVVDHYLGMEATLFNDAASRVVAEYRCIQHFRARGGKL